MSAPDEAVAAHIFDALDHHGDYFREHCWEIYESLRERCPVTHSTAWDGFWMFVDYDDVYEAEQNTELFSSLKDKQVPKIEAPIPFPPIDTDPPQLQQYRKITLPFFSPSAAKNLEPTFRLMATELIDDFIESGEADIIQQLTTPLPARWILRSLGFDDSHWPDWVDWIHSLVHDRASQPEKATEAVLNIYGGITAEMARRRDSGFGDDLLSMIMQGCVDGQPVSDEMIIGYAFLMLLGGMDTTSGLTGNALIALDEHRDLRAQLIDNPSLMPKATEEFLRHDTPVHALTRLVTQDCVIKGQQLHAGDRVLLAYASANRDPKVFNNPDQIDFSRTPNRHLAFGAGPHRCLGSNHARVMFSVMVSEVLSRLPDYSISGEIERYPDAGDVYAPRHLRISFTPGPRTTTTTT